MLNHDLTSLFFYYYFTPNHRRNNNNIRFCTSKIDRIKQKIFMLNQVPITNMYNRKIKGTRETTKK